METFDYTGNIAIAANEMANLYHAGHDVQQTEEYEAWRAKYRQLLCDMAWSQYCTPPPVKDYRTCG